MEEKEYWIREAFKQLDIKLETNNRVRKVSTEQLIKVISKPSYNLAHDLGIYAQSVSVMCKKIAPDRVGTQKLCSYFLEKINKKFCSSCNSVKDIIEFKKNKTRRDGLQVTCYSCHLDYQRDNPEIWRKAAQDKKAVLLRRIPHFGQDGIKEIYKFCPEGYHVDHIVPLQGENVSGLHVVWNLQYLLAKDNLSKGNKFRDTDQ